MKFVKKMLLALTAVAMMVVLLATSAFAAGNSSKQYVYTCFGDSVSAGYGLSGYENNPLDYSQFA